MFLENHKTAANRNKSQLKYIVQEIGTLATIELLADVFEESAQELSTKTPPEAQNAKTILQITAILHRIKLKFFDSGLFYEQGEGVTANERRLLRDFLMEPKGIGAGGARNKVY